ncbi:hypothetical protein ACQVQT_25255 [Bacillus paranthracis]|uniref:Uncharacterized protein n=1 Tax=Bacillus paranthracis TaxID=2026186 RepID=A0A5M9GFI0_9BACI|nr:MULTISPECIES: hypothetical protein [Bacillus]EEK97999.1 hypothetical protein bcere0013_48610 [Bacillus cereus BDRD-ST26]EJP83049.1 hypothetical protein IAU_05577 [Bacillus cereus IS075]EJP96061.1 hypothetical protein IC5_05513 [Bacillus cereus AND1407]EOO82576.1 hypothetical protein IGS_05719 [Bacillus cereus IS845/00]EOO92164.1 hypothetical protein IGQ_05841 [Bacillus cereus IS195]MBD0732660.1 hypothetical protein [Bacillus cereus]MBR2588356.1 hypothetical protein [Bacilli bacterium]
MVFTDLERSLQQGVLTDIRGIVRTLLQDMDYVVVEEDKSIITDAFVEQVIVYLEKTRFFQKWIEVDFSTVELTELLQQMEYSMRRRKSTLRQRNYFNSLLYDLSLREDIPKDYLCMKKRLLQLEHLKEQQKKEKLQNSVSMKQIKVLKISWRKTFGRAIEIPENIKQSEVNELFSKIQRGNRENFEE